MNVPKPVNTEETYMYAMVVRLDALCNMVSSLLEHIAVQQGVATTSNVVEEKVEVVKEVVEEKVEVVEPPTSLTLNRCTALTLSGTQCKRDAIGTTPFCSTHTPKEE